MSKILSTRNPAHMHSITRSVDFHEFFFRGWTVLRNNLKNVRHKFSNIIYSKANQVCIMIILRSLNLTCILHHIVDHPSIKSSCINNNIMTSSNVWCEVVVPGSWSRGSDEEWISPPHASGKIMFAWNATVISAQYDVSVISNHQNF